MMRWAVVLAMLASGAQAGPVFEDRSDALPRHVYGGGWEHFVGGGVAVFDCDGDARPDIFAAGGENAALLLRNGGDFTFRQVAVPELRGATGAYPLDIDADGWMDLYVMRVGPDVVLRGQPACGFVDATQAFGLPESDQWSTAFAAWWTDDRRPQMAVGHYVDRGNPDGPFEACDTNTRLVPDAQGYRAEVLAPGFCSLSMLAARDARGRLGLRISNDRHYYVKGGYEQMWDIGEGRFLDAQDGFAKVSLWGMGIASRDLTGDGRAEVMMTSMGDQLLQLAQADGTYANAPYAIGTYATRPHVGGDGRPSTGWHAQFADVDNDGRADLFIAKGNVDQMPGMAIHDPNNLLMQQADGSFVEAAADAGVATAERSRGAALADFDGDGRLDLLVVNRRAPLELYRNVTEGTGHWLEVSLQQPGGNRNAVGARVRVNGQEQEVSVGGGHASGQATPLHFGLGAAETAQVTVIWPDGSRSEAHPAVDRIVTLRR
ncbi:CRTAC1 family protein [Pseudooceanicola sediminis]|uniref:CRTAC1 family protein n=2 Tax=Pseudooceanicola sediminis TaxID=2211117 RepID=A0A399IZ27_9RHOB|nr:CRTAC1 family protein [Pseudooceanicola sediminis]KAA2316053.1 CRTAC1 family protein [Puniceibacterium sp. HSS470]RII38260.1 CRTAC1 family protein [Pseudooceanicola sediminis]